MNGCWQWGGGFLQHCFHPSTHILIRVRERAEGMKVGKKGSVWNIGIGRQIIDSWNSKCIKKQKLVEHIQFRFFVSKTNVSIKIGARSCILFLYCKLNIPLLLLLIIFLDIGESQISCFPLLSLITLSSANYLNYFARTFLFLNIQVNTKPLNPFVWKIHVCIHTEIFRLVWKRGFHSFYYNRLCFVCMLLHPSRLLL